MITQYCPHLTSVDFGFCDVTIEMLDYLVTGCKSLHTVNFEGCECVNREWVEKLCQLKVSSISDTQVALACPASLYPICVRPETLRTLFGAACQTRGRRGCSVLDEILGGFFSLPINAKGMLKYLCKSNYRISKSEK